ncbi:aldehyde dehydrogenase family protein [Nocardia sp. FBN12]|uniref:aldehyde dehydrogenase family protein n=1 Tax=Nocardia sp. FBN12 TaxID=3419766 RepID=UPI003D085EE3
MTDTVQVTSRSEADRIVERLQGGEAAWARTSLAQRRAMLQQVVALVAESAEEWVDIAVGIKGVDPASQTVGEEWISGPWATLGYLGALANTLQVMENGGDVLAGVDVRRTASGQLALQVLPHGTFDKLLLNGFSAEVWMQPGVDEAQLRREVGLGQRVPHETGGIALVLGAGNITSIVPLDVLYVLFADNRVTAVKLNPISDPLLEIYRRIFKPFIDLGAVEIITGGVEIGTALAQHDSVAAVHMTGSEQTHDAVVWGAGAEGSANKKAGTPVLTKPITSELGGTAPVIVVPGNWSKADLKFQAQHIATLRLHNSGCNCIAAQIVVLSSDWKQKDEFLRELRRALAEAPVRPAWYPGCDVRVADARRLHPDAEAVGGTPERTLITGLDLADDKETAFQLEYFGPVLGVAELPGDPAAFLAAAVTAANDRLRGTLGANVIVHPATLRALGTSFEDELTRLRYGTIGVNAWSGVGYLAAHATWGAFPGHPLEDIESGRGVVHNAFLLADTERTVVRGPFRPAPRSLLHGEWTLAPKPPWFVNNKTAAVTGRRLTAFAARPGWGRLPAIFASALRG